MPEPDWKNPEDYAYLDDCDLHGWAWEFLRRNRAYRSACAALEPFDQLWSDSHPRKKSPEQRRELGEQFRAASLPWGMSTPCDPSHTHKNAFPTWLQMAGVGIVRAWQAPEYERSHLWPGYPHTVVLQFDFRHSIDTQIEIATETLQRFRRHIEETYGYKPPERPKSSRFRKRQFVLYARILDALLANTSIRAISLNLFSDKKDERKNAKSVIATAVMMSESGYRDLLMLPPKPK
jgi:hypothetical protein